MAKNVLIGKHWLALSGVFLLAYPLVIRDPFLLNTAILVLLFITLSQAWNILGGYAGQVSFGHAGLFGIGAYTSSVLLVKLNLTPWLGMVIGGFVASLVGLALGYPLFRLRGHFFAMATLAFSEITQIIFINWDLVGGGAGLSLPVLYAPSLYYMVWAEKFPYYYTALGLAALTVAVVYKIENSRIGIYLKAIKQDEEGAENMGIDTFRYKMVAMAISAFFTALAGSFYAQYILYIDPESTISLLLSVQILVIALFGGRGTVLGPILGALVLVSFSEVTRSYLGGMALGVDFILFSLLIMLIAIYRPVGLIGFLRPAHQSARRL